MAIKDYNVPCMDDLKELPKDEIIEGIIISVDIKTWREILDPQTLEKWKEENRDTPQVIVTYEVNGFKKDEKFTHYEKPSTGSKLGRFMVKYDTFPKVAQKIKINFDDESKASIIIKK